MRSILDVGLTSGSDARERVEALLPPPSRARHLVTRPATFAGPLSSVASIEELWTLPASLHRLVLATQEAGNVTGHITSRFQRAVAGARGRRPSGRLARPGAADGRRDRADRRWPRRYLDRVAVVGEGEARSLEQG